MLPFLSSSMCYFMYNSCYRVLKKSGKYLDDLVDRILEIKKIEDVHGR